MKTQDGGLIILLDYLPLRRTRCLPTNLRISLFLYVFSSSLFIKCTVAWCSKRGQGLHIQVLLENPDKEHTKDTVTRILRPRATRLAQKGVGSGPWKRVRSRHLTQKQPVDVIGTKCTTYWSIPIKVQAIYSETIWKLLRKWSTIKYWSNNGI